MEITKRITKINPIKLVNSIFNKNEWGKNHLILAYGNISVNISMDVFYFNEQTAYFKLNLTGIYQNKDYSINQNLIHYSTDTKETYKRRLNIELDTLLNRFIKDIAKQNISSNLVYSWNILNDDIIGAGYESDLNEIQNIPCKYQDSAKEFLINEVCKTLNEPYNEELKHKINLIKSKYNDYKHMINLIGDLE